MEQGQRIALAAGGVILLGAGVGGLLLRKKEEKPPPQPFAPPYGWQPGFTMPPDPGAHYASATNFDEADFGGGWILRDVRGARPADLNPDRDAHVGMTASLVLTYGPKGEPMVFNAKILQISGDDYQGQWVTKPPSGSGVQLPEFRGAHILALHK
jgi:hypothetical protein